MLELHLTNEGWVPVDIPSPPVCYESSTDAQVAREQCVKTGFESLLLSAMGHRHVRAGPARPRSGPEGSQGKGQSVQGKGGALRKA